MKKFKIDSISIVLMNLELYIIKLFIQLNSNLISIVYSITCNHIFICVFDLGFLIREKAPPTLCMPLSFHHPDSVQLNSLLNFILYIEWLTLALCNPTMKQNFVFWYFNRFLFLDVDALTLPIQRWIEWIDTMLFCLHSTLYQFSTM